MCPLGEGSSSQNSEWEVPASLQTLMSRSEAERRELFSRSDLGQSALRGRIWAYRPVLFSGHCYRALEFSQRQPRVAGQAGSEALSFVYCLRWQ